MMSIGQSIFFVSCLAGIMLALPALLALISLVFHRTLDRTAARLERGWILPFFIGGVPLVMVGFAGTLFLSLGSIAQLLGTIIWLMLLTWGFAGLAGVARLLGSYVTFGKNSSVLLETLIGGLVLAFAIAFPLVGWFVIFPMGVILGTGALTMALVGNLWDWLNRTSPAQQPKYEMMVEQAS